MASEVLQKTRRINKTLQTSSGSKVSFDKLSSAAKPLKATFTESGKAAR